ncbi:MAG: acyl-CoA dehydrogenase family protein [Proteobacteria bacterium]|nr:acyl-CoA dehydrogenase family protein [Pseudomonadota bacterium]
MNQATATLPGNLLRILAAHSSQSEAARQLAGESVDAMRNAGLWRLLVPKRAGGDQRDFREAASLIGACSRHCSAAGWVLMVSAAHDWIIGGFPEAAQDDVWRHGPDGVTPGSLAPSGVLTPVNGGFKISGRWSFNSGAAHGEWFLLGNVERSSGKPRLFHVVVPRADLTLDDNWRTIGLRGTGSVDATAQDAFVPEHRAMDSGLLLGGRGEWARRHDSRLYRIPIIPGLAVYLAAAAGGIAEGAFDAALELITSQTDRYTGTKKLERPGMHMRLAEARGELACASSLVADTLDLLLRTAGQDDSPALRAQAKFQAAYAVELFRRAVDRLMAATGARSAFDDSALQRAFRDLTMAAKHEMINFDTSAQAYGRTLVGLDTRGFPL